MTTSLKSLRLCLALTMLALAPMALGQTAPQTANVEQQMTPQEFKAAGLDKLSPKELEALNAWLQHKVVAETAIAVKEAKQEGRAEVERESRGFFSFGSEEPITSTIVGEFKGFASGRRYKLANGQTWEQIDSSTLAGVRRTDPEVTIKPGLFNNWFLKINGYNTAARVRRVE